MILGYVIHGPQRWSDQYLIDTMGDRPLSVAVTPNGLDFKLRCFLKDYHPLITRLLSGMPMQLPAILMGNGTLPSRIIKK